MSDWFYALTTFIVSAATAFCGYFSLKAICGEKITKNDSALFCITVTVVSWIILMVNHEKNETFRAILIFGYVFALMYKITGNLVKTLFPYIITLAVIAATDALSVMGFYLLSYSKEVKYLVTSVIMLLISLLAMVIKNVIHSIFGNFDKKRSTRILMILTMLSIVGATYLQVTYELALIGKNNLSDSIIGLFVTTLCFTYMNVIIAATGFIRSIKEENKNKIITEQQRILEEMYDSTRVFRHNYRSTIIVLEGYCKNKDYDMLEKRIAELKSDVDDIYANGQIKNAMNISDAGLRNLIMLKIFEARKNGIETNVNITGQHFEKFAGMKMLNALGALLDNAIEAAALSRKGIIRIELAENDLFDSVLIENSFGSKPDLSKISEKGYSTKNQSGLGLYYVNKVVGKDDSTDIVMNCTDDIFSVRLISTGKKNLRKGASVKYKTIDK